MADNWEDEDFDTAVVVPPPKPNWDDEDVDDGEIKESWEDSDEEKETKQATSAAAPARKKVPLAQRIAERNAENERKRQEIANRKAAASSEDEDEDPAERKKRLAALEQAADLENANDMFRGVTVQDKDNADKINGMNPKTKEEFEAFKTALVERIETFKNNRFYASMVDGLVTEVCRSLKDVDIRKISSALSRIANDKQREAKAKEKKKGASTKKPSVQVSSSAIDTTDYGGAYDDGDYDDFM
ncbi:eukaryotic translation initiation factor 3 subunit J [Syncephalis plumigaleata]|nr:eukaryotic translation initiation factor 3 subunit J [Syncephalis plumigaleata]